MEHISQITVLPADALPQISSYYSSVYYTSTKKESTQQHLSLRSDAFPQKEPSDNMSYDHQERICKQPPICFNGVNWTSILLRGLTITICCRQLVYLKAKRQESSEQIRINRYLCYGSFQEAVSYSHQTPRISATKWTYFTRDHTPVEKTPL
jgi:hypothetical protein